MSQLLFSRLGLSEGFLNLNSILITRISLYVQPSKATGGNNPTRKLSLRFQQSSKVRRQNGYREDARGCPTRLASLNFGRW